MDERAALRAIADDLPAAGDDCAVLEDLLLTTDMLHDRADFPDGVTRYTAGWRAVGASLSDVAAMGGDALAALAVYGAPRFDRAELLAFLEGARNVCDLVDASYVGGDLDHHEEFTVASTAVGRAAEPVSRSGAEPGDVVCVTGTLGRSGAALELFERGDHERANDLFRFRPRVAAGVALRSRASAMMDSSDGLARSAHQLAEANGLGIALEQPLPFDESVTELARADPGRRELGLFFGEDFELVCTVPSEAVSAAREACPVALTPIGTVTEPGAGESPVTLDGESIPDRGYTH